MEAKGGVFLREAAVRGNVRLLDARLGGGLDCIGATLQQPGSPGLVADGLVADGGVSFRGAAVEYEMRFVRARISGNFVVDQAQIGDGDRALNLEGLELGGSLFMRQDAKFNGLLSLRSSKIGSIDDEPDSWPSHGDLILDRCHYNQLTGLSIDVTSRIRWLKLQDPSRFGEEFWNQSFDILANFFESIDRENDAIRI